MKKEIGLIIKMPKEKASKEEILKKRAEYIAKLLEWETGLKLTVKN